MVYALINSWVDYMSMCAGICIVFSMVFKTTTLKGTILMRTINSIGCIFFVIYGFCNPSYFVGITNSILLILNIVYLFIEIRGKKSKQNKA